MHATGPGRHAMHCCTTIDCNNQAVRKLRTHVHANATRPCTPPRAGRPRTEHGDQAPASASSPWTQTMNSSACCTGRHSYRRHKLHEPDPAKRSHMTRRGPAAHNHHATTCGILKGTVPVQSDMTHRARRSRLLIHTSRTYATHSVRDPGSKNALSTAAINSSSRRFCHASVGASAHARNRAARPANTSSVSCTRQDDNKSVAGPTSSRVKLG
jgi:hypothetical protein